MRACRSATTPPMSTSTRTTASRSAPTRATSMRRRADGTQRATTNKPTTRLDAKGDYDNAPVETANSTTTTSDESPEQPGRTASKVSKDAAGADANQLKDNNMCKKKDKQREENRVTWLVGRQLDGVWREFGALAVDEDVERRRRHRRWPPTGTA
jgi:hypothetical protein